MQVCLVVVVRSNLPSVCLKLNSFLFLLPHFARTPEKRICPKQEKRQSVRDRLSSLLSRCSSFLLLLLLLLLLVLLLLLCLLALLFIPFNGLCEFLSEFGFLALDSRFCLFYTVINYVGKFESGFFLLTQRQVIKLLQLLSLFILAITPAYLWHCWMYQILTHSQLSIMVLIPTL